MQYNTQHGSPLQVSKQPSASSYGVSGFNKSFVASDPISDKYLESNRQNNYGRDTGNLPSYHLVARDLNQSTSPIKNEIEIRKESTSTCPLSDSQLSTLQNKLSLAGKNQDGHSQNQVYEEVIRTISDAKIIDQKETSIINADLAKFSGKNASEQQQGMVQMIVSYFLQSREFDFFVKRIKNVACTRQQLQGGYESLKQNNSTANRSNSAAPFRKQTSLQTPQSTYVPATVKIDKKDSTNDQIKVSAFSVNQSIADFDKATNDLRQRLGSKPKPEDKVPDITDFAKETNELFEKRFGKQPKDKVSVSMNYEYDQLKRDIQKTQAQIFTTEQKINNIETKEQQPVGKAYAVITQMPQFLVPQDNRFSLMPQSCNTYGSEPQVYQGSKDTSISQEQALQCLQRFGITLKQDQSTRDVSPALKQQPYVTSPTKSEYSSPEIKENLKAVDLVNDPYFEQNSDLNIVQTSPIKTVEISSELVLTESEIDYILSILRHQAANKQGRFISESDLTTAISIVRKGKDQSLNTTLSRHIYSKVQGSQTSSSVRLEHFVGPCALWHFNKDEPSLEFRVGIALKQAINAYERHMSMIDPLYGNEKEQSFTTFKESLLNFLESKTDQPANWCKDQFHKVYDQLKGSTKKQDGLQMLEELIKTKNNTALNQTPAKPLRPQPVKAQLQSSAAVKSDISMKQVPDYSSKQKSSSIKARPSTATNKPKTTQSRPLAKSASAKKVRYTTGSIEPQSANQRSQSQCQDRHKGILKKSKTPSAMKKGVKFLDENASDINISSFNLYDKPSTKNTTASASAYYQDIGKSSQNQGLSTLLNQVGSKGNRLFGSSYDQVGKQAQVSYTSSHQNDIYQQNEYKYQPPKTNMNYQFHDLYQRR